VLLDHFLFAPTRCLFGVLSFCYKNPSQINLCACPLLDTCNEGFQPTALFGGYRCCKCQKPPACWQESSRKENPIYADAVASHGANKAEETVVPLRDGQNFSLVASHILRATSRAWTKCILGFAVSGTGLPDVDFDIGVRLTPHNVHIVPDIVRNHTLVFCRYRMLPIRLSSTSGSFLLKILPLRMRLLSGSMVVLAAARWRVSFKRMDQSSGSMERINRCPTLTVG
jgi:hypothetical protein